MLNIKHYSSYDELSLDVANQIFNKITSGLSKKGKFTLGLATGNSPRGIYKRLISRLGSNHIDLSNLYTFSLDEYYPMSRSASQSFYDEITHHTFGAPLLFANSTFRIENMHVLDGSAVNFAKECAEYEMKIKKIGGIDLQILGLGPNGHIGFNEPGSTGDSRTRKIKLSQSTREKSKYTFDNEINRVPEYGLTMGVGTILEAEEIILIVTGKGKDQVFKKLKLLSQPIIDLPASWLLCHNNVNSYTNL